MKTAKWNWRYKRGLWDGWLRLYKPYDSLLYYGLLSDLRIFAEKYHYELEEQFDSSSAEYSLREGLNFVKERLSGKDLREYQVKGFTAAVREKRAFLLSPTSSGKSFLMYLLIQYYNTKTTLIVPSTGIMMQLKNELIDYGFPEEDIHLIYSGQDKSINKKLTITTWQSAITLSREWFDSIQLVLVDEAHTCTAKTLKTIMETFEYAPNRFGLSGTLEDSVSDKKTLKGLFGRIIKITTTAKLMKEGYASDLTVKAIEINYPENVCEKVSEYLYEDEISFLEKNEYRNNFIKNLVLSLKGNSIIFFRHIEHGKLLKKLISKEHPNVELIYGNVDVDVRENLRKLVTEETNYIILGSYGTMATGIDMPYLNNMIFATAFKAKIKTLQAVGRGLRKKGSKVKSTLIDLGDNLRYKSHQNSTFRHFRIRLTLYSKESFRTKSYKVKLNYK